MNKFLKEVVVKKIIKLSRLLFATQSEKKRNQESDDFVWALLKEKSPSSVIS